MIARTIEVELREVRAKCTRERAGCQQGARDWQAADENNQVGVCG